MFFVGTVAENSFALSLYFTVAECGKFHQLLPPASNQELQVARVCEFGVTTYPLVRKQQLDLSFNF